MYFISHFLHPSKAPPKSRLFKTLQTCTGTLTCRRRRRRLRGPQLFLARTDGAAGSLPAAPLSALDCALLHKHGPGELKKEEKKEKSKNVFLLFLFRSAKCAFVSSQTNHQKPTLSRRQSSVQ